jgi:hypothetical protein
LVSKEAKTTRSLSSWEAKLQRRREFCQRFVAEHHPGMVDAHKIKGARPLLPLGPVRRIQDIYSGCWPQTDKSMSAIGVTYLEYLFERHNLLDHDWMIGRDDQEPRALVSEPFGHASASWCRCAVSWKKSGSSCSCIHPNRQRTVQMLVANVTGGHTLMGAVEVGYRSSTSEHALVAARSAWRRRAVPVRGAVSIRRLPKPFQQTEENVK